MAKVSQESIVAIVAENRVVDVGETIHLAASSPAQMADGASLGVVVAHCLATLRLVFEMAKVSNVLRLYPRRAPLRDGSSWVWWLRALHLSLQQLLRSFRYGDFGDELEWSDE